MDNGIAFPCLSPELFSITAFGMEFALRWYALAYIVGILIAWRMATRALAQPQLWPRGAPMTAPVFEDLLSWLILGIILGGRLGYILFYNLPFFIEHPMQIFMVWQGGMSFHGGFLGVALAGLLYARRQGIALLPLADLLALISPPGLLLGRLANFINAELWGRASDAPWAVRFPLNPANPCETWVYDSMARHPSQLYEALLEGALLGLALLYLAHRRGALKYPGMLTGVFLAGYGAARFVVEFFRQPDAQFVAPGNPLGLAWEISGYGLTQGQALCLPMIAAGIWLIRRARRYG